MDIIKDNQKVKYGAGTWSAAGAAAIAAPIENSLKTPLFYKRQNPAIPPISKHTRY